MAGHRPDHVLADPLLPEHLLLLYAVLLGVQLIVQVVEQAHHAPIIYFLGKSKLLRHSLKHLFHDKGVLQTVFSLIIL